MIISCFSRCSALLFLFSSLALGCGGEDAPVLSDSVEEGAWGHFEFELLALDEPGEGVNSFHLKLRDLDTAEPVVGAHLSVSALMPAMGHEAPEGTTQREMNSGDYLIENLVFTMPGLWEVRFRAESDALVDEAAFSFHLH